MSRYIPLEQPFVDKILNVLTPIWRRYFEDLESDVATLEVDVAATLGQLLQNTHANRATYSVVTYSDVLFYETDRGAYYRSNGAAWVWVGGDMHSTRANAPTDLGANDVGFRLYVSDFHHRVRWDGAAWQWICGCRPTQFGDFAIAPGEGWVLCEGVATTYLGGVGTNALTAVAFTPPNLAGSPAYKKSGAAYTGAINAASGASGSDGAHTHTGPSHTHPVTGSTAAEAAHTHGDGTYATATHNHGGATSAGNTETEFNQGNLVPISVSNISHVHTISLQAALDVTGTSGAGSSHLHGAGTLATDAAGTGNTSSDGAHTHGPGTLDPANLVVLPYMRR